MKSANTGSKQGKNIQGTQGDNPGSSNANSNQQSKSGHQIEKGSAGSKNQHDSSNKQSVSNKSEVENRSDSHSAGARGGSNQQRAEAGQHSGKDSKR